MFGAELDRSQVAVGGYGFSEGSMESGAFLLAPDA